MKNYKNIGWIEETQSRINEESGKGLYHNDCLFLSLGYLSVASCKKHSVADHSSQEISKIPY